MLGVIGFFLGVLYYPVFKSLVYDWVHLSDFSHGFLVPIVSLYLILKRSDQLNSTSVSPNNLGIFIILIGSFLLVVGNLASENFTMRLSFLVVISGIFLFLLGSIHFKILVFPVAFLIFMVPIPSIFLQKITFPMQMFASKVATFSLQILGIAVLREGNIIELAQTRLEVAEACSGIRSLISLLALGTVFAYMSTKQFWQRVVLILACFPIAILVNSLRVCVTGVIANYYGISVADGFFHGFSGYLLFISAFAILAGLGYTLTKFNPKPHILKNPINPHYTINSLIPNISFAITIALLGATILANFAFSRPEAIIQRRPLSEFPQVVGEWAFVKKQTIGEESMAVLQVDDYIMRSYANGKGKVIGLYIGYFNNQREGKQIHSPRQCLPGSGWNTVEAKKMDLSIKHKSGSSATINYNLMGYGDHRELFLWWYHARSRIYANEYLNKLLMIWDAVTKNRTDGALVRINVPVNPDIEKSLNTGLDFINSFSKLLPEYIPN